MPKKSSIPHFVSLAGAAMEGARESLRMLTREVTLKWAERNGYTEAPEPKTSKPEKVLKIETYLKKTSFGCTHEALTGLLEILVDHKIEIKEKPSAYADFPDNLAVVPIQNPNSHNYILGEVAVVVVNGDRNGLIVCKKDDPNIWRGNQMPRERTALRPATPKEIDTFFKEIPASAFGLLIPWKEIRG